MTDQQLYLSVGVPSLAVLIGMLVNIWFFEGIIARLRAWETRLDAISRKEE